MALRLYGVVVQDGQTPLKLPDGVKPYLLRDLCALAEEGDYSAQDVDASTTERHLAVVTAVFNQDAILPSPVGTIFKSVEVLTSWMDLHYVALSDALAWVEDRVAARVHINRARGKDVEREGSADMAVVASEVSRSLRRHAVSTVTQRAELAAGIVSSASYLVERQLWQEFVDAVAEEREKHPLLTIECTGPWPPYDFVRFQFGA